MFFVKIFNHNKFTLLNILLFAFLATNLLDGERGLISYYEQKNIIKKLIIEKKLVKNKLILIEKKNNLLTNLIDLDFLEILYRQKFMIGKQNEKIYYKIK